MEPYIYIIESLAQTFSGWQLLAAFGLLAFVAFVLAPVKKVLNDFAGLFEPPKKELKKEEKPQIARLLAALEDFLVAQIEAKHQEVFALRDTTKALTEMNTHLKRAFPEKDT